ncbi:hypothetical protein EVAR_93568_1 [Eumeta japonica]|uniref:Uncharacterized protein n=1 Tax=Eumeta variegata TaxID=151549 RepID=A0A4C1UR24_EUMVA|nr:hypothetical protein EVAR_93568_1 [Eumeta japonica]
MRNSTEIKFESGTRIGIYLNEDRLQNQKRSRGRNREYPISFQTANNAPVTSLGLQMFMGGGEHLLSDGSPARLRLDYVILAIPDRRVGRSERPSVSGRRFAPVPVPEVGSPEQVRHHEAGTPSPSEEILVPFGSSQTLSVLSSRDQTSDPVSFVTLLTTAHLCVCSDVQIHFFVASDGRELSCVNRRARLKRVCIFRNTKQ